MGGRRYCDGDPYPSRCCENQDPPAVCRRCVDVHLLGVGPVLDGPPDALRARRLRLRPHTASHQECGAHPQVHRAGGAAGDDQHGHRALLLRDLSAGDPGRQQEVPARAVGGDAAAAGGQYRVRGAAHEHLPGRPDPVECEHQDHLRQHGGGGAVLLLLVVRQHCDRPLPRRLPDHRLLEPEPPPPDQDQFDRAVESGSGGNDRLDHQNHQAKGRPQRDQHRGLGRGGADPLGVRGEPDHHHHELGALRAAPADLLGAEALVRGAVALLRAVRPLLQGQGVGPRRPLLRAAGVGPARRRRQHRADPEGSPSASVGVRSPPGRGGGGRRGGWDSEAGRVLCGDGAGRVVGCSNLPMIIFNSIVL